MKFIFCHNLKLIEKNNITIEKNVVVGIEYSNMGSFGVISWTLKEFLKSFKKSDISYNLGYATINYNSCNSCFYETF